jgi:hypothetical protein
MVNPGDKDTLVVEPDATHLSYTSSRPESPTVDLGVSDTSADYSFELAGVSTRPGSTLNLTLPADGGTLSVQTVGAETGASIGLKMNRETEQGVQPSSTAPSRSRRATSVSSNSTNGPTPPRICR